MIWTNVADDLDDSLEGPWAKNSPRSTHRATLVDEMGGTSRVMNAARTYLRRAGRVGALRASGRAGQCRSIEVRFMSTRPRPGVCAPTASP